MRSVFSMYASNSIFERDFKIVFKNGEWGFDFCLRRYGGLFDVCGDMIGCDMRRQVYGGFAIAWYKLSVSHGYCMIVIFMVYVNACNFEMYVVHA